MLDLRSLRAIASRLIGMLTLLACPANASSIVDFTNSTLPPNQDVLGIQFDFGNIRVLGIKDFDLLNPMISEAGDITQNINGIGEASPPVAEPPSNSGRLGFGERLGFDEVVLEAFEFIFPHVVQISSITFGGDAMGGFVIGVIPGVNSTSEFDIPPSGIFEQQTVDVSSANLIGDNFGITLDVVSDNFRVAAIKFRKVPESASIISLLSMASLLVESSVRKLKS